MTQNRKNASGSRSDIGWEHGIEVGNDPRKIKCNHCNEIIPGNIYRFKHHLACTKKDVKACNNVPVEVREEMIKVLAKPMESSKRKTMNDEEDEMVESVSHKRGKKVIESVSNSTIVTTQGTPNQNFEKILRDEACQQIARFFHTSGIPLSCAKNPEFAKMFELVGKCGSEFIPPSYHELENSSLEKEMKNTIDMLEEYRYEWKKTGCSIICDEWTDMKRKFYCNFLVNCPMGTIFLKSIDTSDFLETIEKVFEVLDEIVEKVGEENVIQVITNNAANYKVAVEMLIEKRKRIFWSPCAIKLLDEILEDFEKNLIYHQITIAKGKKISTFIYSRTTSISTLRYFTHGKDLIGSTTTTPYATAYLTLLYLIDMKDTLITMFSLEEWESEELAKKKEREEIQQIVQDCGFWDDIVDCLNFALPIIEVLLKIDSDEKPTMGFIYEEMTRAKESLRSLNNAKGYETIWKIIQDRWNPQLHPLYLASHILNPQLRSDINLEFPYEAIDCILSMIIDHHNNLNMKMEKQLEIVPQLANFSTGLFGSKVAIMARLTKDPAKWWDSYGNDYPELQRIAIRLLSLTCSSCGSGQLYNAYEQVYPKKRSPSYQKKLNDLFLLIQNFKSKVRQDRTNDMLVVREGVSLLGNYSRNEVDTWLHDTEP